MPLEEVNEGLINCFKKRLLCDLEQMGTLRNWLTKTFNNLSQTIENKTVADKIVIGINEAATNIVVHANKEDKTKEMLICIQEYSNYLRFLFYYDGESFKPGKIVAPDIENKLEGGFGLFLMSQIFDETNYSVLESGKNCIELKVSMSKLLD